MITYVLNTMDCIVLTDSDSVNCYFLNDATR